MTRPQPLNRELEWRLRAFREQVLVGKTVPILALAGVDSLQEGHCPSCGDPLAPGTFRCFPCEEAVRLIAKAEIEASEREVENA